MNINIQKISLVIVKGKDGKVIAAIKPDMIGILKMQDRSQNLVITESSQ